MSITPYPTRSEQKAQRKAYIKLINDLQPNRAITLKAGLSCSLETLSSKAQLFFNKVQRHARGRNWARYPADQWPEAVGFFEHVRTDLHLHLAARITADDLRGHFGAAEPIWREVRPAGHYYCESIEDVSAYARYITKEFYRPETRDAAFLYGRADHRNPTTFEHINFC